MLAEKIVKALAHAVKPLIAIHHHRFGCTKALLWVQCPAKLKRINANHYTCYIVAIHLYLCQKVAAVYERKAICLAVALIRGRSFKR